MPAVVRALFAGSLLIQQATSIRVGDDDHQRLAQPADDDESDSLMGGSMRIGYKGAKPVKANPMVLDAVPSGPAGNVNDGTMGMGPPPNVVPPTIEQVTKKISHLEDKMLELQNKIFPECSDKTTKEMCHQSGGKCIWQSKKLAQMKKSGETGKGKDGKDGKGKKSSLIEEKEEIPTFGDLQKQAKNGLKKVHDYMADKISKFGKKKKEDEEGECVPNDSADDDSEEDDGKGGKDGKDGKEAKGKGK